MRAACPLHASRRQSLMPTSGCAHGGACASQSLLDCHQLQHAAHVRHMRWSQAWPAMKSFLVVAMWISKHSSANNSTRCPVHTAHVLRVQMALRARLAMSMEPATVQVRVLMAAAAASECCLLRAALVRFCARAAGVPPPSCQQSTMTARPQPHSRPMVCPCTTGCQLLACTNPADHQLHLPKCRAAWS